MIVLIVAVAVALSGAVQQQTAAGRVVLVSAAVSGRALIDLGVDDFVVEEAGKPREILDVHLADYPVAVLIDNSAGESEIGAMREAAARFVSRIGERGVAVGTLAEPAAMVASFDNDRATVLAKIRDVPAANGARLAPLDAIAAALRMISETESPFSAVVVISARAISPAELSATDLLTPILESRAAVHVIARRPAAAPGPEAPASSSDVLRELGTLTHGQYTTIYSPASYAIALDRLADRLASEMMIQYLTTDGAPAADVRVGVKIPGAKVTGLGVSR